MNNLCVKNLNVKYSDFTLDVSFDIKSGDIVGFIGANGAGKSTTIKSIMRIIQTDLGQINYNNQIINDDNVGAFRENIGYIGEFRNYYPHIKAYKIARFVSRLYKQWDNDLFNYYIEDLFKININKKMIELSEGTKVKFALALAMSHNASILLLDEPTNGLDPIIRDQVLEIIKQYISDSERMALFSSYITQDIEKIANKVIYIVNGSILLDESINTIFNRYRKVPCGTKDTDSILQFGKVYNGNLIIEESLLKPDIQTSRLFLEDVLFYLNGGLV